jgi:hypothetical protein
MYRRWRHVLWAASANTTGKDKNQQRRDYRFHFTLLKSMSLTCITADTLFDRRVGASDLGAGHYVEQHANDQ